MGGTGVSFGVSRTGAIAGGTDCTGAAGGNGAGGVAGFGAEGVGAGLTVGVVAVASAGVLPDPCSHLGRGVALGTGMGPVDTGTAGAAGAGGATGFSFMGSAGALFFSHAGVAVS